MDNPYNYNIHKFLNMLSNPCWFCPCFSSLNVIFLPNGQINKSFEASYTILSLCVKLYTQSSPRMNAAIEKVCELLNETQTEYPVTKLIMNYKIAT